MSTQINQYLIFGVRKPFSFVKDWSEKNGKNFYDEFEEFIDDSAFNDKIGGKDGIFCLYDGMSGGYVVIGKVIKKTSDGEFMASDEPMTFEDPSFDEIGKIDQAIRQNFGIDDDLKFWFVTHYR